MFKKLTVKEQLKAERAKNSNILAKQCEIEEALFEIASLVSKEVLDGETVLQQDN